MGTTEIEIDLSFYIHRMHSYNYNLSFSQILLASSYDILNFCEIFPKLHKSSFSSASFLIGFRFPWVLLVQMSVDKIPWLPKSSTKFLSSSWHVSDLERYLTFWCLPKSLKHFQNPLTFQWFRETFNIWMSP